MDQFGIFAKYWQPGAVKTRLAATIGSQHAADVSKAFLETLVQRCLPLSATRVLAFSPPSKHAAFEEVVPHGWRLQAQVAGDLGDRMFGYFQSALLAGAQRVVLIGSDSPTLPLTIINDAFAALDRVNVVLGPSEDGGYYLIGVAGVVPGIFDRIAWSSSDVLRQTIERLQQTQTSYECLPTWYDVDTESDLRRLQTELQSNEYSAPIFDELRTQIDAALSHS